ncbi:MAG: hypothetical protein J5870_03100 [Clostridia bacterium]|nr:hypothetical protein [Clostridia bacterium]
MLFVIFLPKSVKLAIVYESLGKYASKNASKFSPRTILYATDGKTKKVGHVEVNSLKLKGSGPKSNFDWMIAQQSSNVNKESETRHSIAYTIGEEELEAEEYLDNATDEEIKAVVDAVDRELLGDAMYYGRTLAEQKRKTQQKVKEEDYGEVIQDD